MTLELHRGDSKWIYRKKPFFWGKAARYSTLGVAFSTFYGAEIEVVA